MSMKMKMMDMDGDQEISGERMKELLKEAKDRANEEYPLLYKRLMEDHDMEPITMTERELELSKEAQDLRVAAAEKQIQCATLVEQAEAENKIADSMMEQSRSKQTRLQSLIRARLGDDRPWQILSNFNEGGQPILFVAKAGSEDRVKDKLRRGEGELVEKVTKMLSGLVGEREEALFAPPEKEEKKWLN